jgi:hypothetical protein
MRTIAVLAVALLGLIPGAASARRAPTPEENAAIVATDDRQAACLVVSVSTLDDRWALIEDLDSESCWSEGRPAVAHRVGERWVHWYSSEALPDDWCAQIDVPDDVGVDLGACMPSPRDEARLANDILRRGASKACLTSVRFSSDDPLFAVVTVKRGSRCGGGPNGARLVVRYIGDRWRFWYDASQGVSCSDGRASDIPGDLISCTRYTPQHLTVTRAKAAISQAGRKAFGGYRFFWGRCRRWASARVSCAVVMHTTAQGCLNATAHVAKTAGGWYTVRWRVRQCLG